MTNPGIGHSFPVMVTEVDEALGIAGNCRHYAMCKIDFLGTGVCASGVERGYVSFYPEGRMDLYAALAKGKVHVTEKCVEIAQSCDLCGKCDYQCCFVTGLRPTRVMEALKSHVARHLAAGKPVAQADADSLLQGMRRIVGDEWATNDRAIAVTYSHDPSPLAVPALPRYVIMPGTRQEISSLLKLLGSAGIPWVVRGNGTNLMGFELCEGAVIDLNRMKEIEFDEKNWSVRVGPGVAAFELQREAAQRGYRVNVAEPAALVCGTMMCAGIVSLFSTAYGSCADNYIDAEFVRTDGSFFSLNEKNAPNLFAFDKAGAVSPGVCSSLRVKLHPMTGDESGALVPFDSLEKAIDFSRDCAMRRIGLAIGILGTEYLSSFMSPTQRMAAEVKDALARKLGIDCMVLVLGDKYAMASLKKMGHPMIGQDLFRVLSLGLPSLGAADWLEFIAGLSEEEPFGYLKGGGFADLAEAALCPSASRLVRDFDPDLRPVYEEIYSRPDLTDLVWLNMFRITSSRIGRQKQFFPFLMYLPLDRALIDDVCTGLGSIALRYALKNDLGFITPVDGGKRCVLEYDYFFDQNDGDEIDRIRQAAAEAGTAIDRLSARTGTIRWVKYIFQQGYCRKENLLYA